MYSVATEPVSCRSGFWALKVMMIVFFFLCFNKFGSNLLGHAFEDVWIWPHLWNCCFCIEDANVSQVSAILEAIDGYKIIGTMCTYSECACTESKGQCNQKKTRQHNKENTVLFQCLTMNVLLCCSRQLFLNNRVAVFLPASLELLVRHTHTHWTGVLQTTLYLVFVRSSRSQPLVVISLEDLVFFIC